MTCAGDTLQYCGGPNRLNVYINNGTSSESSSSSATQVLFFPFQAIKLSDIFISITSVTSTSSHGSSSITSTSATTSFTSSSASPTSTSLYTSDGCWTDSTGNRALDGAYHTDPLMTISICETFCSSFAIFGVEYGQVSWPEILALQPFLE